MFTPKNEDIVHESRGNNTRRKSRDVSVVPSSVRALWQERSPSVAANSLMFSQVSLRACGYPCRQTFSMSAFGGKADINRTFLNVRF